MPTRNPAQTDSAPSKLLWHYTSLDTLTKILDSNYLFATEVSFQNDTNETVTANVAFNEVLDEMEKGKFRAFAVSAKKMLRDIDRGEALPNKTTEAQMLQESRFILCASEQPDSLYAWRTYGHGSIGCAIGLDPASPLGVVDSQIRGSGHQTEGWVKVLYSLKASKELAREQLELLAEEWNRRSASSEDTFDITFDEVPAARANLRARVKDGSFVEEDERRITIDDLRHADVLSFTPSAMGPRPQLRLAAASHWGVVVKDPSSRSALKLPIREIRLGPNPPGGAKESLQWLLLSHGYTFDPVVNGTDDLGNETYSYDNMVHISGSAHSYRAI